MSKAKASADYKIDLMEFSEGRGLGGCIQLDKLMDARHNSNNDLYYTVLCLRHLRFVSRYSSAVS